MIRDLTEGKKSNLNDPDKFTTGELRRNFLRSGLSLALMAINIELASCGGDTDSHISPSNGTGEPSPNSGGGTTAPTSSAEFLQNVTFTAANLRDRDIVFSGNSIIHITDPVNPLDGATINLISDNIWIFFDNILPSGVLGDLENVKINGIVVTPNENARLVRYLNGSVLISQGSDFSPLSVFDREFLSGNAINLGLYKYYKSADLAAFSNNIASFSLRKGYMATFSTTEDGAGYSEVFISDRDDLVVDNLPDNLKFKIVFIRIFPWRWVSKKGLANGDVNKAEIVKAGSYYDWNNDRESTLDVEYIPIRQNRYWPSLPTQKKDCPILLGYNEPNLEHTDSTIISVDEAVARWPSLLATGLRLGTPAPSDSGQDWVIDFVKECKSRNYRVDFAVLHFYRAHQTVDQFLGFLKYVHDATGLPIWVTEFNNGANWTSPPDPTQEENAAVISAWCERMNDTPWVERYFIYEWVGDSRRVFVPGTSDDLTATGTSYKNLSVALAYDSSRLSK